MDNHTCFGTTLVSHRIEQNDRVELVETKGMAFYRIAQDESKREASRNAHARREETKQMQWNQAR